MIAMFTMIMPMFRDLAGDTEMPPLSAAIFGISDFMINQGYILVIVLIAIIIVLRLIIKTPSSKLKWDEMLLKLPKVGGSSYNLHCTFCPYNVKPFLVRSSDGRLYRKIGRHSR